MLANFVFFTVVPVATCAVRLLPYFKLQRFRTAAVSMFRSLLLSLQNLRNPASMTKSVGRSVESRCMSRRVQNVVVVVVQYIGVLLHYLAQLFSRLS